MLEIPFHDFGALGPGMDVEARRLVRSVAHWHPLLGGYSGYTPSTYPAVSALVLALPDERALALLVRTTGLSRVILHRGELDAAARTRWDAAATALPVEAEFGDDVALDVRDVASPDLVESFLDATASTTPLGTPRTPVPEGDSIAEVAIATGLDRVPWPHRASVAVNVRNAGSRLWPALGRGRRGLVTLGSRWRDGGGAAVAERADAGRLPWDLEAGAAVTAFVTVAPPRVRGPLVLEIGVVQDGRWFSAPAARCYGPNGLAIACTD